MRESVIFYGSWKKAVDRLGDGKRGQAFEIILDYALDGKEPQTDDPVLLMVFDMVCVQIDVNNRRYENGKKGGRPKNQNKTKAKPKQNQSETKPKPNKNKNINININDNQYSNQLKAALDDFIQHRKQIKAPMTSRAYELMLSRLKKLSGGNEEKMIAILHQSIENGWKGVFELKDKTSGFNNAPKRDYDMSDLELKLLQTN